MTDSQQKAMNLSRTEREVHHCGQFNEILEAMKDYNEKIYENHQEVMKDAYSYERTMFDLKRYGVENSMIAELRIPKMDCDLPLYLGATRNNMSHGAYFLYIQNLDFGDKVYIDNLWETLNYRVSEIKVISTEDIPEILQAQHEKADGTHGINREASIPKDTFVELESLLTGCIPVILVIMMAVLWIITSKRFLHRKKRHCTKN